MNYNNIFLWKKNIRNSNNIKKQQTISAVILNYNRPELVQKLISILLKNNNIKEIILSNGKNETKLEYNNSIIKVFDDYGENNEKYGLHLRFLRAQTALYNKILIIDDDIISTQNDLNKLISIDTDVMVGYYGRVIPYSPHYDKTRTVNVPIILTKFMLINKSLADMYMKIISEESKLLDILKIGKPWGNGEDILISALSIYITGKLNICLRLPNIKDVGNNCPIAICNRNGLNNHIKYRTNLCNFLFKNSNELTDNIKSLFTNLLFNNRIEHYLGSNYSTNNVYESIKSQNLYSLNELSNSKFYNKRFYNKNNMIKKLYIDPLIYKLQKYKNKKFLCQFGDRCKNSELYNSWSFTNNNVIDDFSFVKIRRTHEKNPVILRCLNFKRHWLHYYKKKNDIEFSKKKSIIVWRGATTGYKDKYKPNRFNFIEKWFNVKNVDVGFTYICQNINNNNYLKYKKNEMSIEKMLQYKYIVSIEGNDKDSGINWKLNSNSLVFMAKPTCISWLMEDKLLPNVHYIELKNDYSDLLEKYEWCEKNQEKCIQIIKNANNFMDQFKKTHIEELIENELIKLYFEKLKINDKKNNCNIKTLFTSYKCEKEDTIVQSIIKKWSILNPSYKVLYFSDKDIDIFFKETPYYNTYKQMKNGVAIADFFRICYINKYGGYWFDIDLQPIKIDIPNYGNIHLFDVGYKNISYMFIGGKSNQKLFNDVIIQVNKNIIDNIKNKKEHVINITGPKVIQNIISKKLNININSNGNFPGNDTSILYLQDTEYEFVYTRLHFNKFKTNEYEKLLKKYNQVRYTMYNYI